MKKNNKKGFTIVELVIVIAVIAILSAVLIPTFGGVIDRANETSAQQAARSGYTDAYAKDLTDGVIDGKDSNNNTLTATSGDGYYVSGGSAYYQASKGDFTYKFGANGLEKVAPSGT